MAGAFGGGPAIVVKFLADTKQIVEGVDKVEGKGSKLKTFGKIAGAAFAGGAILSFGTSAVKAAEDASKSGSRLSAIFKSMGDTSGTAASGAEKYAGALSKKIGVDDDAIMAAQAQLATFQAVGGETGRTAGIFDRATSAAADLAAAGFGSLDTNAVQLGKALQDPSKGITALARSGVTFTDAQKKQIDAMQKSGDLLGAQKVVLGAVEQQVKGTAEATATSSDKMNVAFGETQEAIGGALMPVLQIVAPMLQALAGFIQDNIRWLAPLAAGVLAVAAAIWVWNAAMDANPIMLIAIGIALLIAAIVLLVKNWDKVTAAFKAAFDWLATQWGKVFDYLSAPVLAAYSWIKGAFDKVLSVVQGVLGWIKSNWPTLLAILTGPVGVAVLLISRNWDTIKSGLASALNWIRSTWHTVQGVLTAPFTAAWGVISGIFGKISGGISSALSFAKETAGKIANAVRGPINAVIRAWNGLQFKVPEVSVGPIHFGGQTIGLPNIPELATGGITRSEGLAWLHPAEVIAPLSTAAAMGGNQYNIVVEVPPGASPYAVGAATVDAIRSYERVAGTAWRNTP